MKCACEAVLTSTWPLGLCSARIVDNTHTSMAPGGLGKVADEITAPLNITLTVGMWGVFSATPRNATWSSRLTCAEPRRARRDRHAVRVMSLANRTILARQCMQAETDVRWQ